LGSTNLRKKLPPEPSAAKTKKGPEKDVRRQPDKRKRKILQSMPRKRRKGAMGLHIYMVYFKSFMHIYMVYFTN